MSDYVKPQPAPENAEGAQSVWALVLADLQDDADSDDGYRHYDLLMEDCRRRNAQGIAKYGVPLVVHNKRDPATDAYQEAQDGMAYWKQEYERTKEPAADLLYRTSVRLAKMARDYLYRRDGK